MTVNSTCIPNGNHTCVPTSSSAGLAVGLTLFFLLLVIIAAVLVYKYHGRIRDKVQIGRRRSQTKQHPMEAPEAKAHQYTSMMREPSTGQTPIYENLTAPRCSQPAEAQRRSAGEPDEDLYLQCDTLDDAIYSNDPAFSADPPQFQEEDLYVVPDAL